MKQVVWQGNKVTPSKIVCIGRNYVEHIEELGNDIPDDMVVFNKPNSAIGETLIAYQQEPIHYETEMCFLVQNGEFIAVAIGLDLTKRQMQTTLKTKGLPWERAKAFDNSALFTEFKTISSEDIANLSFQLTIDGNLTQKAHVDLMMYSPEVIKKTLADFITLENNDIVMSGTPKGVGQVTAGCLFSVALFIGDKLVLEQSWRAR